MIAIQERIDRFLSGELNWSVEASRVEKLLPLIRRLTNGHYYSEWKRNGKYCHLSCKCTPWWEITNTDLRQLRKVERKINKDQLLKEKEAIEKLLGEMD